MTTMPAMPRLAMTNQPAPSTVAHEQQGSPSFGPNVPLYLTNTSFTTTGPQGDRAYLEQVLVMGGDGINAPIMDPDGPFNNLSPLCIACLNR